MTTNNNNAPVRRALISVSDKEGIVDFARALRELGVDVLSTGGTAKLLREYQIDITDVSDHTGFPEIMDGRVKTLHPKVHGGILARRGTDDSVLDEHAIDTIDLVVVNLYPFQETIAKPDCTLDVAIENIDIGGPTMLRAAAKNYAHVGVVVDSLDYQLVLDELREHNTHLSEPTRFYLARKTFTHTAQYDVAVSRYLNSLQVDQPFPDTHMSVYEKKMDLRYGENPHQHAALYTNLEFDQSTVVNAEQLQGKELSYNNIADADAALNCIKEFDIAIPTCVIVKHANPCGVAIGTEQENAYQRAYATDSTSAFGGIIAFNQPLNAKTAEAIIKQQFVEVIIAPGVDADARDILLQKLNVRVLSCQPWPANPPPINDYKRVVGGLLVQTYDQMTVSRDQLNIVTERAPSDAELQDLLFAWKVVKFVKSNAIVYVKDEQTVGIGAGQMSRVISAKIASIKAADANLPIPGGVMASDAFFPFRDGIDTAAKAGIKAIIQPGGSIRDEEIIQAANEAGIAMVFTGIRHFRHS